MSPWLSGQFDAEHDSQSIGNMYRQCRQQRVAPAGRESARIALPATAPLEPGNAMQMTDEGARSGQEIPAD